MLMHIPENLEFTFVRGSKIRAYTNKEGILKVSATSVSWEDLMYALAYEINDTNICPYCGQPIRKNKLTLDHIYPRDFGGISITNNLIPCCRKCNSDKGSLNPEEFGIALKSKKAFNEMKGSIIDEKTKMRYKRGILIPNEWVTYCYPCDLKVRGFYKKCFDLFSNPKPKKIMENLNYIKRYNHLKRPVVTDKNFVILDGYSWYVAAIESGQFRKIPIIRLENVEVYF